MGNILNISNILVKIKSSQEDKNIDYFFSYGSIKIRNNWNSSGNISIFKVKDPKVDPWYITTEIPILFITEVI